MEATRRINDTIQGVYTMRKLLATVIPLLLLAACSLPREPEEQWARPGPEEWCERYAGGTNGAGPSDGNIPYYDRNGGPYFTGPRLSFRDPYFRHDDPLKKDAVRECLEKESTG